MKTKKSLKLRERISYACGDAASNVVWAALGAFVMMYYTDVAHVNAGVIGVIMMVSRFLDGASDLIMGLIVDRTKSKYGKARPWLLRIAIPFAIATVLMFSVPDFTDKGKIIYIFVTYNLVMTMYTMINLPYGSLSTLMTDEPYERSILNIFRQIFAQITSLIITSATLPLIKVFGEGQKAWTITYGIFAAAAAVLFLICFAGTKETVGVSAKEREVVPVKKALLSLLKNKCWIISMFLGTGTCLFYMAISTVNSYFCVQVLHKKSMVGTLNAAYIAPMIVFFFLMAPIVKRIGKKNTNLLGWLLILLSYIPLLFAMTSVPALIACSVLRGIGYACVMGVQFAIIGDSVEYGEWKTGVRSEGLVFSAQSFGCKVGMGLGSALIGALLSWSKYDGELTVQPDSAITVIKILYVGMPILVAILQMLLMIPYTIEKEYDQMHKELEERAAAK
ncbi:MAG: MFS transporter [Lachnospiraceae bacterium]|nr:MFS transporter [Lachnospiraceae bacterium]